MQIKQKDMWVRETKLKGCYIIQLDRYNDERGSFMETYNKFFYKNHSELNVTYVQDNLSVSNMYVLRGLHFQTGEHAQAKLVSVVKGSVLDVVVDIRVGSPTYGEHVSVHLSESNRKQVFVPKGFAHGFISLEMGSIFTYKCDNYYNKESESGIIFNDKDLDIDWKIPSELIVVSEKDLELPTFRDIKNS